MLKNFYLLFTVTIFLITLACAGPLTEDEKDGMMSGDGILLQGAGATFPYPLYSKWISEYNKLNSNVKIDYQSIGSGGGIRQIKQQTVDFGATDVPMTDEQQKSLKKPIIHIPTTLGAVVVCYNLPNINGQLKLTSKTLTAIFLGEIKKWNDPKIVEANPDINLPDKDVTVVHRSDGSGTTAVFVDYLSKISPVWFKEVGKGTSVDWPVGLGGKGNEGVTGQIKQIEGTVGYVELVYALQNKLPFAALQNKAGKFINPNTDAVTAAATAAMSQMPDDMRLSITDADGEESYPIASYTYLLIYQDTQSKVKAQALADFLKWSINDGQKIAKQLNYAPLPIEVTDRIKEKLKTLKSKGQPLNIS